MTTDPLPDPRQEQARRLGFCCLAGREAHPGPCPWHDAPMLAAPADVADLDATREVEGD